MSAEEAYQLLRAGRPQAAAEVLEKIVAQDPGDARAWFLLGASRHASNDFHAAAIAFGRSTHLAPADVQARLALISVQRAAGKPQSALESASAAVAAIPGDSRLHFATALVLEDLGHAIDALTQYQQALQADPAMEDALHNRGLLLARLGRRQEALESHQAYASAVPGSARAHADLADILLSLNRHEDSLQAAQRAMQLDPRNFGAALSAGFASAMLERFDDAQAWFDRCRSIDAARFDRQVAQRLAEGLDRGLDPRAVRLIRGFDQLQECDWRDYAHFVSLFRSLVTEASRTKSPLASVPLIFRSLAIPMPLAERRMLADGVASRLADGVAGSGAAARAPEPPPVRVGYVSPDFGTHPTGILSSPVFARHDRARFEVHAFSLSPDDGSDWRRRVRANADQFHEMHGLELSAARRRVADARIDILVDLAGATTGALPELFASRSAPVQVSYLGFPGTTGRGYVDFLVCDSVCVPEHEGDGYAESLIRLPDTFWICDPGPEPGTPPSRRLAGLPEDAFVLYAHHPGQKITPGIFGAWMDILRAVPYAVLWLLADRPDLPANLRREAQSRGIAPQRLVFAERVPYDEYRRRIPLAHLALDTPVYNGGATTLDALACGLPVLTCPGEGFAGRMAASALLAADLPDLVAGSLDDYRAKAISIARQRDTHANLVARVKRARTASRLFDVAGRVRQLEAAYLEILQRAAAR